MGPEPWLRLRAEGSAPLPALRAVLVSLQNGEASLFEVNIRYIGGLLATYYLTGEEVCAQSSECPSQAQEPAERALQQLCSEHQIIPPITTG